MPWIQVSPISAVTTGRSTATGRSRSATSSSEPARSSAPGRRARSSAHVVTTSSAEGGPRLSPVISTTTAVPVPGTTCSAP